MNYYVLTNQIKKSKYMNEYIYVSLYISVEEQSFYKIEKDIESYWENDAVKKIENMSEINIPELGDYFFGELKTLLLAKGMMLHQLEIFEKTTKKYCVSEQLIFPGRNISVS